MIATRGTVVVKFGGTSLGTPARIRRAARRVAALVAGGRRVVAVVSAMGHTTDHILETLGALETRRGEGPVGREVDRALATGEDLSAALLATALHALGVPARSLRGGEAGVRADGEFGAARVARVDARKLRVLLTRGVVPVVSGFQGQRADREVATLGRGGSDTSAVAIAAALGPAACHIVTDVDAVYDRDPRRHADARPLRRISHDQLVDLARSGARVVATEAARLARTHGVPLRVLGYDTPPQDEKCGTFVGGAP
jgi:aspartate kinase